MKTIKVAMIPLVDRQLMGEDEQIRYQPSLPIRLRTGRFVLERYALIDTGAETCLIDRKIIEKEASADLARRLAPIARFGEKQYIPYYDFELDICDQNFATVRTLKHISFAAVELPLGTDIVVGNKGVLEYLKLTIDYPRHQIEFELPQKVLTTRKQSYLIEAQSLIQAGNYSAAIVTLSSAVELTLADVSRYYGIPTDQRKQTFMTLVNDLSSKRILDYHSIETLMKFIELRNLVMHGVINIKLADAKRALVLVEQIISDLEIKNDKRRSSLIPSAVTAFVEIDMAMEYIDNLMNSSNKRRKELFIRAMKCEEQRQYAKAANYLQQALDTDASGSERTALLTLLGTNYLKTGRIAEANDLYLAAKMEAHRVQDMFGLLAVYGNLGLVDKLTGRLVEAQKNMEKAIALCEQLDFATGKIGLLANLATVSTALGSQDAARKYSQMAFSLARNLGDLDPSIKKHTERVTELAVKTATLLELSNSEITAVQQAALFHDLGMLAIPDMVLEKRGRLTNSDFDLIKLHAAVSSRIAVGFEEFAKAIPIIQSHHERYDGTGYPYGLTGNEIPAGAQILGLADTFDALTSDRPYRPAMSFREALQILRQDSGRLWQVNILEAFAKVVSADN
ncbi:MAG: HD domain-containing phosphohydrolase [Dehalococcoidia bacterium]|jgi:HD-GYP domain-containing protein (c-di-GMP phosphodiesterase class II)